MVRLIRSVTEGGHLRQGPLSWMAAFAILWVSLGQVAEASILIQRDAQGNVYMTSRSGAARVISAPAVSEKEIVRGSSQSDGMAISSEASAQARARAIKKLGPTARELELTPLVIEVAKELRISPYLLKAMIKAESDYDTDSVSRAGAKGLMQLMDVTAQEMKVSDVFDPKQNMFGGVGYFKKMLERYNGIIELALAAYNAGPGNVDRHGGIPPFDETRRYVKKVMNYWRLYRDM